jgi:hypothetical protein
MAFRHLAARRRDSEQKACRHRKTGIQLREKIAGWPRRQRAVGWPLAGIEGSGSQRRGVEIGNRCFRLSSVVVEGSGHQARRETGGRSGWEGGLWRCWNRSVAARSRRGVYSRRGRCWEATLRADCNKRVISSESRWDLAAIASAPRFAFPKMMCQAGTITSDLFARGWNVREPGHAVRDVGDRSSGKELGLVGPEWPQGARGSLHQRRGRRSRTSASRSISSAVL